MERRMILSTALIAGLALACGAQAAPPENKDRGQGHPHGSGNKGQGQRHGQGQDQGQGNAKDKPDQGNIHNRGHVDQHTSYDSHGRNRNYFDEHRDGQGRLRNGDTGSGLIFAGITSALARKYAIDSGVRGYASLPPGIRKNLARGKPLPPGIAKKLVPGQLLNRLPRYDGYEWRVVGTDLILIAIGTAVVADILYDVFD